jgi:hypothetical protein
MRTLRISSRAALFVGAIVLVVQISPAGASGGQNKGEGHPHGSVEVTFTKWLITGGPIMAGFTGGAAEGVYAGEVLERYPSIQTPLRVVRLVAIYEVQADDPKRSFTALVQGGQHNPGGVPLGGTALLDGRILAGWRTGAAVHVEYDVKENCDGAPAGRCFEGTITIQPTDHDDDHDH